jgi:hypothetical protein
LDELALETLLNSVESMQASFSTTAMPLAASHRAPSFVVVPRRPVQSFALIACQRSGTQLLREVLNTNPQVALLAEPFSIDPQPVYWNNFVRGLPAADYPPRLPADAMAVLDKYLAGIYADVSCNDDWYGGPKVAERAIGLDVKYNQIRFVRPMFDDLRARPVLLDYFASRGVKVVHLVRRNLAHASLSIIISNLREVWHDYDGRGVCDKFRVPVDDVVGYMHWIHDEREEFMRLADDLDIHTCAYEDLAAEIRGVTEDGRFGEDVGMLNGLADFLGVEPEFRFHGKICKVLNRPYHDILANYDDVVAAVASSAFPEFACTL